ncbi:MAG: PilN domain-containing protein [Magnetococcales bacterium]|nr:PilN domain-containing protein [Magnetococcales bacterium]
MIRINLIPYREGRRLQKVQMIIGAWGATLLLGILLAFLVNGTVNDWISEKERQKKKNTETIAALEKDLGEVKDIKEIKEEVRARLDTIASLQNQRDLQVHILDELALSIPKEVWISQVSSAGALLTVNGRAISNAWVAQFMRMLDASPYFGQVDLTRISQVAESEQKVKEFTLQIAITPPLPQAGAKEKGPTAPGKDRSQSPPPPAASPPAPTKGG